MRMYLKPLGVSIGTALLAGSLATANAPALADASWGSDDTSSTGQSGDLGEARKLVQSEDYNGAIPLLKQIAQKQPQNADVFNMLGYSHRKLGDFANAQTYYDKALAIDPKHQPTLEYLGELYLQTDRPAKAEALRAQLKDICGSDCKEYRMLSDSILAYKKKNGG